VSKALYSGCKNPVIPSTSGEQVGDVCQPSTYEQQLIEIPLMLQHERHDVHQKIVILYRDDSPLVTLPVVFPPGAEPSPRLEWGRQQAILVQIFPLAF
jgi:hypothetical protein